MGKPRKTLLPMRRSNEQKPPTTSLRPSSARYLSAPPYILLRRRNVLPVLDDRCTIGVIVLIFFSFGTIHDCSQGIFVDPCEV